MSVGWVLAVDLGTSGLKVGAVAESGEILGSRQTELVTTFTDDGGAEQDVRTWWEALRAATDALTLGEGQVADATDLIAVGITGQYASTVPVNAAGEPVGPCLTWADDRGGPYSRAAFGGPAAGYKPTAILPWLRYGGGAPSPNGADPSGHALFLKHERPDIYREADHADLSAWGGQYTDRDAWSGSLRKLRDMHPQAVHFCHDTRVVWSR